MLNVIVTGLVSKGDLEFPGPKKTQFLSIPQDLWIVELLNCRIVELNGGLKRYPPSYALTLCETWESRCRYAVPLRPIRRPNLPRCVLYLSKGFERSQSAMFLGRGVSGLRGPRYN